MLFAIFIVFICKHQLVKLIGPCPLIVPLVCYIPGIQKTIGTTRVPVEHFFLPATFGLGILCMDEGRKYAVKRWPSGFLAKIAW